MKNKIMLITYADSFGKDLKELKWVVDRYFKREINGIHVLPFFPSSGDRGFSPVNYREVDPAFGDWEDVKALAVPVMAHRLILARTLTGRSSGKQIVEELLSTVSLPTEEWSS